MITIKIMGGVGNQLFQYALGYALKERFNKQIQFDISYYNSDGQTGYTFRELIINVFNLNSFNENISSKPLINNSVFSKSTRFIERTFLPYYKNSFIQEKIFQFDPNIFNLKRNAYLYGFWQSPRYFEGLEMPIREQFSLKNKLSDDASSYSELIKTTNNSISIHIRRGDYLSSYSHIFCSQSHIYYTDGLNYIKQKINSNELTLFIFSDDIEWCKKNVNYPLKTIFVSSAKLFSFEDMILMSQCNHNIIANSSYSWWGAWLNNNLEKVVICPNSWYKNVKTNAVFTKDLFPASWIRI